MNNFDVQEEPISFSKIRELAKLPALASGLAGDKPVVVAPANASSLNDGILTSAETLPAQVVASGLPVHSTASEVLRSFSWRTDKRLKNLLTPVIDQGTCGCCWAVASIGCINDRVALRYKSNPLFLFQEVMACDQTCKLCAKCSPSVAFEFAQSNGLTSFASFNKKPEADSKSIDLSLQKFEALGIPSGKTKNKIQTGQTGGGLMDNIYRPPDQKKISVGKCEAAMKIVQSGALRGNKVYVKPSAAKSSASILSLKHTILQSGPVVTIMRIYSDFIVGSDPQNNVPFAETEGVYVHRKSQTNYGVTPDKNKDLGAHCMVIVGWGTTAKGIEYWEIRNSWGELWGDKGYCKVATSSSPLNNKSIGVDLAITTVRNNITTTRYGNLWFDVQVSQANAKGKATNAQHLYSSSVNGHFRLVLHKKEGSRLLYIKLSLLCLALTLGLLFLYCTCGR